MSDLRIIDCLLCLECLRLRTWDAVYVSSNIAREAMDRLRGAWEAGELPVLTAGLAAYFERHPRAME